MAEARTIVVVGASLAGHSTVAALRAEGYDGRVVVVGNEGVAPYDRPPLSKAFLAGKLGADGLILDAELDALVSEWQLGTPAAGLDLEGETPRVLLADGTSIEGDLVVLATGARARTLTEVLGEQPQLEGLHHMRTLADADALRRDLERGGRLVVVGGGFIGCEVAATARGLGLDVVVLEAGPQPLAGPLGEVLGSAVGDLHRRHGVDLRCGASVAGIRGADRVEAVVLADGTEIPCDTVLAALGSVPEVDWLRGSGLDLDGGVRCDDTGSAAPGVMAVGDCAAWFDPLLGRHHRIEHWTDAFERAGVVARFALGRTSDKPRPAPYFWSDQYDVRIQFAGRRDATCELRIEDGSAETDDLLATWWRDDEPVAVVGLNRPRDIARWRRQLASTSAPA